MAKHESRATRHNLPVPGPARTHVAVTGTGRVERAADTAQATFIVEGIRPTAAQARSVAAGIAAEVLGSLTAAGLPAADIRTAGIEVTPTWDHDGNRAVRTGFTVTNRISALVRDLELVGAVLDAGLESGATGLDGVSFQLADATGDATQARRLAVEDARARAATIAEAAGGTLGRLVSITEDAVPGPTPRPAMRMAALAAESFSPTPVLPGSIEVAVTVTAEWEVEAAGR